MVSSITNALNQISNDVTRIDMQGRMRNMPSLYWGGCFPMFPCYNPIPFSVFNMPLFNMPTFSPIMPVCGGSTGYPFGLTSSLGLPNTRNIPVDLNVADFEVLGGSPINWNNFYAGMTGQPQTQFQQSSTSSPSFSGNANNNQSPQINMDYLYHPEKYRTNTTQQADSSDKTKEKVTASAAQVFSTQGRPYERPLWYTAIFDKDPKTLTDEEKNLKNIYEKIFFENSVYVFDKNANVQFDDANRYKVNSKIHCKIRDLYEAMHAHDDTRVLNLIRQYTPDELAAIDYWWTYYAENSKQDTSGLTLRQMAQKACCWGMFDFLKWKCGKYDAIFEELNKKTLLNNPSSMSDAFYQGLKEDFMCGAFIDNENILKLLEMLKNKPAYAKAVAEEYGKRFGDSLSDVLRNGRFKMNDERIKNLTLEVFK